MENCALKSLLAVIDNKKEETLREIFFNKDLRLKELLLQLPLMLALPNLLRFCFGLQASNTVSFFFFLISMRRPHVDMQNMFLRRLCSPGGDQTNPRH